LARRWPFSWICRLFSGAVPFMMAWMRDIFVVTACSGREQEGLNEKWHNMRTYPTFILGEVFQAMSI